MDIHLPDAAAPASPAAATAADSPPDENDVEMLPTEPSLPLTLPAHIAARFYRKPSVVRRSSAASSRRNSVSSLHSNHSNGPSSGSLHPDHVAQHLRRVAILESRKARLAERALHAEKVRLRAARAKASTRNLQREERALAAQQARERLLAEITAKCEEEVRRAKKKAEDIKEKKAAEYAQLRLDMEEKFAGAEKRRLLYQQSHRRHRTSSLPASEEKKMVTTVIGPLKKEAAATAIQRAWRYRRLMASVSQFTSLGVSVERFRGLTFDEVGAMLSSERVLGSTAKVLRMCELQDMESAGSIGERGAVRTFLSSFMIATHATDVLSSNGEQEQDLVAKAEELLVSFEQVISLISLGHRSLGAIPTELQSFRELYNVFFSAFHAWKTHDSSVLIDIMVAQFVELELIWQTVKNDRAGGVADDYQEGIRQNQIMLLARLKRLAGSDKAMHIVRDAVKKAKRERKQRQAPAQAIPRAAEAEGTGHPPTEVLAESAASPPSETFSSVIDHSVLQELDKQRISPHERFTRMLSALPENRNLVHELLIDKDFKIDETQYTEPRKQIMRHVCEMMRRDVEAGMGTDWTVAMATVIQDRLLRSLRPGTSLHVLISEVLDPKLVENQCKAGAFSYEGFFEFMQVILPKLCAPYRDSEIERFAHDRSGDEIDRLARLMRIIDLLSLDHTNFLISVAAPQLIQEAPGYEQRTFDRGLQDGSISLGKTKQFLRTNRKLIVDEMKKRDPENVHGEPRPSANRTYAHGLVDLVLSNAAVSTDIIPETLDLDRQRLERLHARAFRIVATASILLTAKNLLKRDVRSQWKLEADRILSLDFTDIKPDRIQSILESTHPMPSGANAQIWGTVRRTFAPAATASITSCLSDMPSIQVYSDSPAHIPSAVSSFSGDASNNPANFGDPVARLLLSRLRIHVLGRLNASSASERVRVTSMASQNLAGAGMPEFVNEVGKLVEELKKIRDVDWASHGAVYENLWAQDISPGDDG